MTLRVNRHFGVQRKQWRLLILQNTWRIDWRTPNSWQYGVIVTLKRWL